MTTNKFATISYIASGHIEQVIQITDPNITGDKLVEMLNNGEACTTIHEGEGNHVILTCDWETIIGDVISTEPELDYGQYLNEGEFELPVSPTKTFDASHVAISGSVEEFIHEPEMSLDDIFTILEKAGDTIPLGLTIEHGYRDLSGTELRNEIDMFADGLKSLMVAAYSAAKQNQELI